MDKLYYCHRCKREEWCIVNTIGDTDYIQAYVCGQMDKKPHKGVSNGEPSAA